MYSEFRRDILLALAAENLSGETMNAIMKRIDLASEKYSIGKASTEIAVRGKEELEEAAKVYLVCKKLQGQSDETIYNDKLKLANFIDYCNCPLKEITANVIRKYLLLYKMNRNLKDNSLDKIRGALNHWFKWLQNEGYITVNPMANVDKIRFIQEHKPAINQTELEALREVCRTDQERCLVEVLYSTGCRISEALNIKIKDIRFDLPQPEVKVIGKGKKPGIVYFSPRSITMIKKYLKTRRHDSEWLFCNERGGGQMQRENAAKKFRELRGLAGLEEKRVTAHTMRHTFATQAGKTAPIQVVQQMLRHSKLETTMIYVETSQDDVKAYHAKAI